MGEDLQTKIFPAPNWSIQGKNTGKNQDCVKIELSCLCEYPVVAYLSVAALQTLMGL